MGSPWGPLHSLPDRAQLTTYVHRLHLRGQITKSDSGNTFQCGSSPADSLNHNPCIKDHKEFSKKKKTCLTLLSQ